MLCQEFEEKCPFSVKLSTNLSVRQCAISVPVAFFWIYPNITRNVVEVLVFVKLRRGFLEKCNLSTFLMGALFFRFKGVLF